MPDIIYPNPLGLPTCQRCNTLIFPSGHGPRCLCEIDRTALRAQISSVEEKLAAVRAEIAKKAEN